MAGQKALYSPAELVKIAGDLVKFGRLTQAQAEAMLRQEGVHDPASVAAEATADPYSLPTARPEEFVLPKSVGDGESSPQSRAFYSTARGWLSDAGFAKGIGEAVAAEADQCAEKWAKMGPDARELSMLSSKAAIQSLFGPQAEAKLAMARDLVARLDKARPGLIQALRATGAGNSPFIIAQLVHAAERAAARRGGK